VLTSHLAYLLPSHVPGLRLLKRWMRGKQHHRQLEVVGVKPFAPAVNHHLCLPLHCQTLDLLGQKIIYDSLKNPIDSLVLG
jgi:hypothetical protein